tara:strand:+ start:10171 stop:10644 length:474 start_codon:yes stop_codon:yes gene_type:complete
MTASRDSSLLRLQQGLMAPAAGPADVEPRDLLPFEAANARWAVPCAEVARVVMPSDVISLTGYAQLPTCVVGVVATDSEMLSVVDVGLLMGIERSHSSLKSRLIIFGEGPLKGLALLVDRVHERVSSANSAATMNLVDAASLHSRLQQKSPSRREVQ